MADFHYISATISIEAAVQKPAATITIHLAQSQNFCASKWKSGHLDEKLSYISLKIVP